MNCQPSEVFPVEVESGPAGGVLSLTVTDPDGRTHTLVGYCRYWHTDGGYGGFNCADHAAEFGGPVGYWWDGSRFVQTLRRPPVGVPILTGEWVPGDVWAAR